MAAVNLLETKHLSKTFGGLNAVQDISFALQEGQVHAIIGPNGAGKTTFVSLLSGRIQPTAGEVWFDGELINEKPAWQRVRLGIAYTFQITSIYPELSVFENVAIAAQLKGKIKSRDTALDNSGNPDRSVQRCVLECLEKVGLDMDSSLKSGELAYGHQRLLEIAMGLALSPKLLILDEPTQGLSDLEITEFIELVGKLRDVMTILIIEHNMPLVMSIADRITVLDQGTILAQGSASQIQNSTAVQQAYLGG